MNRTVLLSIILFNTLTIQVSGQDFIQLSRQYLLDHKNEWNLSTKDIYQMIVSSEYFSEHTGIKHIYFKQQYNGIEVHSSIIGMHLNSVGEIVHMTSSFVEEIQNKVIVKAPSINPQDALSKALEHLDLPIIAPLKKINSSESTTLFERNTFSDSDIPVKLCYYPDRMTGYLHLAYQVDIDETGKPDFWNIYVDAVTGELLKKGNYTLHCAFGVNHTHSSEHHCKEEEHPEFFKPSSPDNNTDGQYYVFPMTIESPIYGSRSVLTNPGDLFASPFGWQDTNGMPGIDLTITKGNNVHAFSDEAGSNVSQGDEPDGGTGLRFNFPFDSDAEPETNKDAAVTQLYYANNVMHDFAYHYGFDEAAGNFQLNNYRNGGKDSDYVIANAQDGADDNNATFATLQDGTSGRMQMHLWDASRLGVLQVLSPSGIAGKISSSEATFGPRLTTTAIEGDLVLAKDNSSSPDLLCESAANTAQLRGNVALIGRGGCFFEQKVKNAQDAGAIAVIVCNVEERTFGMGGTDEVEDPDIPAVMIKQSDCQQIKLFLDAGVRVKLQAPELEGPTQLDAAFDNGIVAHEYAHGISNRLVGGPEEVSCLFNDEQMGEGWSDFFTLVMTTHPDRNQGGQARGIGNYVIRAGVDGSGIRRQPYSTDLSINNQTYDDIITSTSAPHPVGEIWTTLLWDLYWAMIEEYGWDDDIYAGTGGNNRAVQLVMDGMKLANCNPGFVDGRDAILAADRINYGGENECLIWNIFAKRGLGIGADQGASFDRRDGTPDFQTLPRCLRDVLIFKNVTETIDPGDTVDVKITVFNYKGSSVSNVVVTDNLPLGTTYIPSLGSTDNLGENNNDVTISIIGSQITFAFSEPLANGDSLTLDYRFASAPDLGSTRWFFEGAERNSNQMQVEDLEGDGEWLVENLSAFDGRNHWYIATTEAKSDQVLQISRPILIDGEQPVLRFYHKYVTEPNFDGGIVQISTDGVNWEIIEDNQFLRNPYRGEISYPAFIIPNANGFWGSANTYRDTYIDLSPYQGAEIYIRFRFANLEEAEDRRDFGLGWFIDNIEVMDLFNYYTESCVTFDEGQPICALPANRGTAVNSNVVITSLEDEVGKEPISMTIYPNPSVNDVGFTVQVQSVKSTPLTIEMYNVEGRLTLTQQIKNISGTYRSFIDTQQFNKGFYTLKVITSNGIVTRKIIVN